MSHSNWCSWVCRSVRIYAPSFLVPVLWSKEEQAVVRREREQHRVAKVAKEFIVKVRGSHHLLADEQGPAEQAAKRMRAEQLLAQTDFTWDELFELEILAVELAPLERLPAVAPALFSPIQADHKRSPITEEKRNGVLESTRRGQRSYFKKIARERAIDLLRLHLLLWTCALLRLVYWYQQGGTLVASSLAIAAGSGLLGSFFSILRRIQGVADVEKSEDISMLMNGSWSLILSLISGIVSGVLLYFFFAGHLGKHLFSEDLIPAMTLEQFDTHIFNAYLSTNADYGRMVVWGFISGFSERFIPDLLSKLQNKDSKAKAPADNSGKTPSLDQAH